MNHVMVSLDGSGELFALVQIMNKLGHRINETVSRDGKREKKREMMDLFFLHAADQYGVDAIDLVSDGEVFYMVMDGKSHALEGEYLKKFRETYIYDYLLAAAKRLKQFMVVEHEKYAVVTSSFDEYF